MLDLAIVLAFVAYSVSAGWRARRQASENLTEYFLAGRSVEGWKAGLSMAATQYAADTPLLVTGLIATAGVYLLWTFWIYGFTYLLFAFVFNELWRRARVLTDAELTEVRYSGRGVLTLRVLKAIYYGTVANCFFLAMVLIAALRIAEVFLPWHTWLPAVVYAPVQGFIEATGWTLGAGLSGLDPTIAAANGLISLAAIVGFVFLYATTGGLRGVVATDVMQFLLMMIGTVCYAGYVLVEAGGLDGLGERLVTLYGRARSAELLGLLPAGQEALLPFLAMLGLQGLFWISSDGTGYLAQRAMACRTDRGARIAGVVFSWAQNLVRSLVWLVIGAGLLVLYPFAPAEAGTDGFAAARELTFVTGIADLMPPGLRGIMLTALLAALASTVDTHLNLGASYWSNDLYKRLVCQVWLDRTPGNTELVLVARLSNVVILALALGIMVNLGSIQATWFLSLVFGAGIGSVLMLRWLWARITLYSEIAAIAASLAAAPFILAYVDAQWARLAWMVAASTTAAIGITFVTPQTAEVVLQRFYEQVRPAGWWPQQAAAAGEDQRYPWRQFGHRLRVTGLMTASLFLLLIGGAKLLVHLPGEPLWMAWGCLVAACALAPFWGRDRLLRK